MRGEDWLGKWREIFKPIERFTVTFTQNGKREFVPHDPFFPLIVVTINSTKKCMVSRQPVLSIRIVLDSFYLLMFSILRNSHLESNKQSHVKPTQSQNCSWYFRLFIILSWFQFVWIIAWALVYEKDIAIKWSDKLPLSAEQLLVRR